MKFRCNPLITNIFWKWGHEGAHWTEKQCKCELDWMQGIGIDSVILVGLDIHIDELNKNKSPFDSLAYAMEEAARRGIEIIFGGASDEKWCIKKDLQGELEERL